MTLFCDQIFIAKMFYETVVIFFNFDSTILKFHLYNFFVDKMPMCICYIWKQKVQKPATSLMCFILQVLWRGFDTSISTMDCGPHGQSDHCTAIGSQAFQTGLFYFGLFPGEIGMIDCCCPANLICTVVWFSSHVLYTESPRSNPSHLPVKKDQVVISS